jgi:hypothetical protein
LLCGARSSIGDMDNGVREAFGASCGRLCPASPTMVGVAIADFTDRCVSLILCTTERLTIVMDHDGDVIDIIEGRATAAESHFV